MGTSSSSKSNKNIIESIKSNLIDSLRKTLKGHKNWNLEREREKEREQVNSAISKSHTFIIIKNQKTVNECERESGREDFFFLLLAFLIKEWRVNEIERKRERRAFWAWHSLDHQNHSSKRDFSFIVF